ncbi:MAG: LysR family transcriptional regulator [Gammaproteobacteria bacterium]
MPSNSPAVIDLRRMRIVVEVARANAITTAAQTLGLTQSAVSRSVAEVEQALGQRLFDRLPRGIELTDAGRLFVARAKRVLVDVDDLVAEVSDAPNRVSGRVRLGITATGAHAAAALVAFARRHPDVAIETLHASDQSLCPRLLHGELDLLIGSSSYLARWRDLELVTLSPLHFGCMVRRDHPLVGSRYPSERDMLAYPLILPESIEPTYSDIAQRYARHGLPRLKPHYVTNNFELIKALLRVSDAFLPMLHPDPDFGALADDFAFLREVVHLPPHHLSYARAPHRPRTRVIEALEQVLVEVLGVRAAAAAG